jgi:hypothetical protein
MILDIEKVVKFELAFGIIFSSIYVEYKNKYDDSFAEFIYKWPLTDH